jgi:hypothetical protein
VENKKFILSGTVQFVMNETCLFGRIAE